MIGPIRGFDRRTWLCAAVLASSSLLFIAFVAQLPVALLGNAVYDDAWFWHRAASIASGHWMGDYDSMTLMKGAGYPLFLAMVHLSSLSVMTAQALLYCGACLLFGAGVQRMSGRPWLSLSIVLAIQWHPSAYAWTRVLRDYIGAAQLLLALGCLLLFLFAANARSRGWRWAVVAGLAFSWLWSTREDGVWILPGVAILVLARGIQAWRDRAERRRLAVGLVLMSVAFAGWLSLLATVNHVKYGSFVTVDTRDSPYADALSALQRVRVGAATPYVPVPRDVREAVYVVSPAFARLRPQFEGGVSPWTTSGCGLYPHSCGDFAGGWFMWAFRDAVTATGGYASAPAADAFYRQVAAEVEKACDDGRLTCVSGVVGLLPPMTAAQWKTMPSRLGKLASMLTWQGIGDGQTESYVDPPTLRAMWLFVGRPMLPDPADMLEDAGIPRSAEASMALRWTKYRIGQAYGLVLPWLAAAGLLAFAWATLGALRRRRLDPLLPLAAAAWSLVAGRGLLMALVDMTSFPAIHVHYLQPAFPLLLMAAIISLAAIAPQQQPNPLHAPKPAAS